MANPQAPGLFEHWITNRQSFLTLTPKSGDTGDFEKWITDRIYWHDYVEVTAIARIPRYGFVLYQIPAIV